MDQDRAGLPRAGGGPRLRPEGGGRSHQGIPDGSPGVHHEASPLPGETQEIIKVS